MNMITGPIAYPKPAQDQCFAQMALSPEFLRAWAEQARPGETVTYYRGACLVKARITKPNIEALAAAAWDLAERGKVAPLQRKTGLDTVYFIARV